MAYSSSLTDAEWEILEPLLPEILPSKKRAKPLSWSYRALIDSMLYQLKNGCNWEDLPKDLPPCLGARSLAPHSDAGSHRYSTVFWHYNQWRKAGSFASSSGRYVRVSFLYPLYPLNVSDDVGLLMLLILNLEYFKSKPVNIPKITVLLDNGYHLDKLIKTLEAVYPSIMRKIRFELSPKPSKAEKAAQGKIGFVPVPVRWVIERSNAWMERCKSLTKYFERTLDNAKAQMDFCFGRLMLKRLDTNS